ncbi:MAG TPA: oligoendopeptidase F, partial [Syntrophomonas sp.]|nr:oligoendopeptidase F [Syntrophomonas sp.]
MSNAIKKRHEIAEEYKWKLEDAYANEEVWEEDFKRVQEVLPGIESFKGRLQESADVLYDVLQRLEELQRRSEKLYVYARMRRDEDNANNHYQTLFERIERLSVQVSSTTSYVIPEITVIPVEKIEEFFQEKEELKPYRHFLEEL